MQSKAGKSWESTNDTSNNGSYREDQHHKRRNGHDRDKQTSMMMQSMESDFSEAGFDRVESIASSAGGEHEVVEGGQLQTDGFDQLFLDSFVVSETEAAWNSLLASNTAASIGEAVFSAIFENAASLEAVFTSPKQVIGAKFMESMTGLVKALGEPERLRMLVEALGFAHLQFEVTMSRVVTFQETLIDILTLELGESLSDEAKEGVTLLMNYVGGAMIFLKAKFGERIQILQESWQKVAQDSKSKDSIQGNGLDEVQPEDLSNLKQGQNELKDGFGSQVAHVPTTYNEMFMFNATVMGFNQRVWFYEVLACFHNLVVNVGYSGRLQEECHVLALRINRSKRVTPGPVVLSEYKSCMLASLRSLLPKTWTTNHELAWSWLWENVERLLRENPFFKKASQMERALSKVLIDLDETQKYEARRKLFVYFFEMAPAGQDYFKQSNTYLHFIAERMMNMTLEFYRDPTNMVDEISALGLRHVGYGIPTELFPPFVAASVQCFGEAAQHKLALEAFRVSVGLIGTMLMRTITEGATIVMKAINNNCKRQVKKAISCAPRGERAKWLLIIQVGTQSISPLEWAVQSGKTEAGMVIIKDLLTLRADRERYYYGADELFTRHRNIVKLLRDHAPCLLPVLLDGLIWRSRVMKHGMRRVNYYLQNLLIQRDGQPAQALEWIAQAEDPVIVCHPVVVLLTNLVWRHVVYISFLTGKSWLFFTLLVFIASQSSIELRRFPVVVFSCRAFVYLASMTQLIYSHVARSYVALRDKDTSMFLCLSVPNYLSDWQESASMALCFSLLFMFALEPAFMCVRDPAAEAFSSECDSARGIMFMYSAFSTAAMFLYYVLLVDMSVFSNRISAYLLVCGQLAGEVGLFMCALFAVFLVLASAVSVLSHDLPAFGSIPIGFLTLTEIFSGIAGPTELDIDQREWAVLCVVFGSVLLSTIFLLNLLVAQLTCAYDSILKDMVGIARLGRMKIIVEMLPKVPKRRWDRFVTSLRLGDRLEFNEGDVGLSGGVQVLEPVGNHLVSMDYIRRFGGTTESSAQWPKEPDSEGDDEERFERMEKVVRKTMKVVTQKAKAARKKVDGDGTTQQSGSFSSAKSDG